LRNLLPGISARGSSVCPGFTATGLKKTSSTICCTAKCSTKFTPTRTCSITGWNGWAMTSVSCVSMISSC